MAEDSKSRAGLFLFYFVCVLSVFALSITLSSAMSRAASTAVRVGLCMVFLVLSIAAFQFRRWKRYWLALFACFTAAFSLLMASWLSDYGLALFSLTTKTPAGIAVAKLSEAAIVVFFILLLQVAIRSDRASIYFEKGRLPRGLTIGLVSFGACAAAGVAQALAQGTDPAHLFSWTPWILVFALANGFMEELLFRGIFLRRLEPLVGAGAANLLTAIVFALAHARVAYAADVLIFLGITFVLGWVWGYIIQKTESLIGSWLFHAGADVLIIIGAFASL